MATADKPKMRQFVGKLTEETKQTLCVYRYRDMDDGIIKYVGIVRNGLLSDRILGHFYDDKWAKDKVWQVDYFKCDTQSEVEAFEGHLIALYGTDKYLNIQKAGWGLNKYLPDVEDWWRPALIPVFADTKTLNRSIELRGLLRNGNVEKAIEMLDDFIFMRS
jgi:hypothetical protein